MYRPHFACYKFTLALFLTIAVMAAPVLGEIQWPAPRQVSVRIGTPWAWYIRTIPRIIPCIGGNAVQASGVGVFPRVCTTDEDYTAYTLLPGPLVATFAADYMTLLVVLVLLTPQKVEKREKE